MAPVISILMGIYNCETTLAESIDSLLAQTFCDWELIMYDDGSSDHTYELAKKYADQYQDKIFVYKNKENLGLNVTLNKCASHARGKYLARQDGDDVSLPARFETEVDFLDKHPEYAIVSTPMILYDEKGDWGKTNNKTGALKVTDFSGHGNPICHAPCMMRREAFEAVGGYNNHKIFRRAQDYNLWCKMYGQGYKAYNLDTPLYKMRDDQNAVSRRTKRNRLKLMRNMWISYRVIKMPYYKYVNLLKPLVYVITPTFLYEIIHKRKSRTRDQS